MPKSRLSKNNRHGKELLLFVLSFTLLFVVAYLNYSSYISYNEDLEESVLGSQACKCKGHKGCSVRTSGGHYYCVEQDTCDWVCNGVVQDPEAPNNPPNINTCSSYGITKNLTLYCKGKNMDIPGSKTCSDNNMNIKECCEGGKWWAHGGCCPRNDVYCGCAPETTYQELRFCKSADPTFLTDSYGPVRFNYKTPDSGKCSRDMNICKPN